jgi:hypothetical protein
MQEVESQGQANRNNNQGETTFKVFASHSVTNGNVTKTKQWEQSGTGFGNFKPFF